MNSKTKQLKYSSYIACSLDGYIAREDGELDWLHDSSFDEDYGFDDYFTSVGALVMGTATFKKVLTFDPWPYNQKPVYVISHSMVPTDLPEKLNSYPVEILNLPIEDIQAYILSKQPELSSVYVDGGKLLSSFIEAGLLSEITINLIPKTICKGLPLFSMTNKDVKYTKTKVNSFRSGLVQITYTIN